MKLQTLPIIVKTATQIPAAPTPAMTRPTMRKSTDVASAQSKLPNTNIAMATKNTDLPGAMDKILPNSNITPA
jgi:hypothetical protein